MADDISLRLPYPPSVNHYYKKRAVRKKDPPHNLTTVTYISKEGKDYRYTVAEHVWEQLGTPPKLRQRLALIVKLHHGPGHKQDIDNGLKSLFDSLEYSQVFVNDSQIDQLLVVRKRRVAKAYVEVLIKTIGESYGAKN